MPSPLDAIRNVTGRHPRLPYAPPVHGRPVPRLPTNLNMKVERRWRFAGGLQARFRELLPPA